MANVLVMSVQHSDFIWTLCNKRRPLLVDELGGPRADQAKKSLVKIQI